MEKKYLKLNDIDAYKIAFNLSNYVWDLIVKLDRFSKDTLGIQFVRAVDSISANIAEGFGRYSKKDKVKFFRIGFGSMYESLDWNEKALKRKLISKTDYDYIYSELQKLPKLIHQLIKFTNSKLSE
ncbi:MAG: four helix bundle protein [Ignavibacteriota bacterium]|nr:four helix bundle protein [Ignavibacteriota bacterium]MCO6449101.1 four helix bundle protein [Ignavibacterium album]MCZ2269410.1 four helix bundle protein [Ignavibacteriales bacterium]QKJ99520.1 MAG: four helix bundle protein [Ignavibacteriota bacterium]HOJ06929.1 four helix bundle protein [Ignavibacteriaceae bacterium]